MRDLELNRRAVGLWIKGARKARGWTQTDLGEYWGVTQANISLVEQGRHEISYARFLELCSIFEIDGVLATDQIEGLASGPKSKASASKAPKSKASASKAPKSKAPKSKASASKAPKLSR